MPDFIMDSYLWIKAFHILAVIAWMAGLLYLPRLLVYHYSCPHESDMSNTFCIMERRLLRIIMNPSMIASFIFGVLLIFITDPWSFGWFHTKLLVLVFLSGYHGLLAKYVRQFSEGERPHSEKYYRLINEIPFVLAIVIVIMAVVKPF